MSIVPESKKSLFDFEMGIKIASSQESGISPENLMLDSILSKMTMHISGPWVRN